MFALAVLLTARSPARAAEDGPAGDAPGQVVPPDVRQWTKRGDRAAAHKEWDEAIRDLGQAAKLAPDDARLTAKLRRALERRARSREALAAAPPPEPPGLSDAPPDAGLVPFFKDLRWRAKLKREALEARADAEAARPMPDEAKLAKLRSQAGLLAEEEARLTKRISEEKLKADQGEADQKKAFEGVDGVDPKGFGGLH